MAEDMQLKILKEKVVRKRILQKEVSALRMQKKELVAKTADLEKIKQAEQKDVDKLEKGGLSSLFYSVIGKKEEKLDKERAEAAEAVRQYEEATLELERVNRSIEVKETELDTLDGYEEKFEKLLQGKRQLLADSGTEAEQKILEAEQELEQLKEQEALLKGAVQNEKQILEVTAQIQADLDEAEKAAINESSAGMAMGIRKSELLGRVQKQVSMLKPVLEDFERRIKLIETSENKYDHLDVVYEFGNGIYTSFIAASSVMSVATIERIRTAKGSTMLLRKQMQDILPQIEREAEIIGRKIEVATENLENIIIEA